MLQLAIAVSVCVGAVGCSSESENDTSPDSVAYQGVVTPTEDFEIPKVESDGKGGYRVAPAKDGNFPAIPAAKVLYSGETYGLDESQQPAKLNVGDYVSIRWKMYGLRSGELVEDSDILFDGSAPKIILGGGTGAEVNVPQEVHDALKGQRVGDKVQVVFQYEMPGLPEYLDSDDAYTLVVDIVDKS